MCHFNAITAAMMIEHCLQSMCINIKVRLSSVIDDWYLYTHIDKKGSIDCGWLLKF